MCECVINWYGILAEYRAGEPPRVQELVVAALRRCTIAYLRGDWTAAVHRVAGVHPQDHRPHQVQDEGVD